MAGEQDLELSGWLERVAEVNWPLQINDEGEYDSKEAAVRFEFLLREALRYVAELNELFDLDPSLARTDSVKNAVQKFHKIAKGLCLFMASEGLIARE